MKLLRTLKSGHVFQLSLHEKQLLLDTIRLYPLVPAAHYRLSRGGKVPQPEEDQRLLEGALAEQRRENQRQALAMLNEPERFCEVESGFELRLTLPQIEWLLQVLNDVRVGSWLALGKPESDTEPAVTKQNAKFCLALQVSGLFQSALLAALGVSQSPDWSGE